MRGAARSRGPAFDTRGHCARIFGIGVLGRDPKPDDEGRFPRPKKERAECVEKRACTKEWYKALRSIGSRGIRSHGYVTSSNTTPQTALVTPPII